MVVIKEQTSRNKELVQTLLPLVKTHAKTSAPPKAITDFVVRLAIILEEWDFSPKELSSLDKRAFIDLVRSWQVEATPNDLSLIRIVV